MKASSRVWKGTRLGGVELNDVPHSIYFVITLKEYSFENRKENEWNLDYISSNIAVWFNLSVEHILRSSKHDQIHIPTNVEGISVQIIVAVRKQWNSCKALPRMV